MTSVAISYEYNKLLTRFTIFLQGDSFRRESSNLGEVSSLLTDVHVMSLTATVSKAIRNAICSSVGMNKVLLVSVS